MYHCGISTFRQGATSTPSTAPHRDWPRLPEDFRPCAATVSARDSRPRRPPLPSRGPTALSARKGANGWIALSHFEAVAEASGAPFTEKSNRRSVVRQSTAMPPSIPEAQLPLASPPCSPATGATGPPPRCHCRSPRGRSSGWSSPLAPLSHRRNTRPTRMWTTSGRTPMTTSVRRSRSVASSRRTQFSVRSLPRVGLRPATAGGPATGPRCGYRSRYATPSAEHFSMNVRAVQDGS